MATFNRRLSFYPPSSMLTFHVMPAWTREHRGMDSMPLPMFPSPPPADITIQVLFMHYHCDYFGCQVDGAPPIMTHRELLMIHSSVFATMFNGRFGDASRETVLNENSTIDAIGAMIDYMRNGRISTGVNFVM